MCIAAMHICTRKSGKYDKIYSCSCTTRRECYIVALKDAFCDFFFIWQKLFNACNIPGKFCLQHSGRRTATDDMNETERKRSNNSNCLNTMLLNASAFHKFFFTYYRMSTPSSGLTSRGSYVAYWNLIRWIDFARRRRASISFSPRAVL